MLICINCNVKDFGPRAQQCPLDIIVPFNNKKEQKEKEANVFIIINNKKVFFSPRKQYTELFTLTYISFLDTECQIFWRVPGILTYVRAFPNRRHFVT